MLPQRIVTLHATPPHAKRKDRSVRLCWHGSGCRSPRRHDLDAVLDAGRAAQCRRCPKSRAFSRKSGRRSCAWTASGIGDNFFDLGGNSKLSINVVFEAKQAGLNITLSQLYQHQTIAELARVVRRTQSRAASQSAPVAEASSEPEPGTLVTIESLRAFGREALTASGIEPGWRRDRDGSAA